MTTECSSSITATMAQTKDGSSIRKALGIQFRPKRTVSSSRSDQKWLPTELSSGMSTSEEVSLD
jgi:hypothetical protein